MPVWHGRITLPTIGQFEVAGEDRVAGLRVRDSTPFLESGEGTWIPLDEVPSFPLRSHSSTSAGRTMCWTVDDIDPYRTFAVEDPARLAPDEFENWRRRLDDAWSILVEEHAEHVQEVTAAEPVIVPVAQGEGSSPRRRRPRSALLPRPRRRPGGPRETVVHELQHSKLNALLDLVPLQLPVRGPALLRTVAKRPTPPERVAPRDLRVRGCHRVLAPATAVGCRGSRRAAVFHFAYHREQIREALRWLGHRSGAQRGRRQVPRGRVGAVDGMRRRRRRGVADGSRLHAERGEPAGLAAEASRARRRTTSSSWPTCGSPGNSRSRAESRFGDEPFNRSDLPEPSLSRLLTARALDPEQATELGTAR